MSRRAISSQNHQLVRGVGRSASVVEKYIKHGDIAKSITLPVDVINQASRHGCFASQDEETGFFRPLPLSGDRDDVVGWSGWIALDHDHHILHVIRSEVELLPAVETTERPPRAELEAIVREGERARAG